MNWNKGELRLCEGVCGEVVKCLYVVNPYLEEINGEEKYEWMCESCYDGACDDI